MMKLFLKAIVQHLPMNDVVTNIVQSFAESPDFIRDVMARISYVDLKLKVEEEVSTKLSEEFDDVDKLFPRRRDRTEFVEGCIERLDKDELAREIASDLDLSDEIADAVRSNVDESEIAERVADAIAQKVESKVEEMVESKVEEMVESKVAEKVEESVAAAAAATLIELKLSDVKLVDRVMNLLPFETIMDQVARAVVDRLMSDDPAK